MGRLSVVATPIGNLEDVTLRALRVLKEADYILCEDTRVTGKLLKHYEIDAPTKRYDAHASEKTHEAILEDLRKEKHIALVSDAGTPGVSDPGVLLIDRARKAGAVVEAIPGPSAVTAAFSIAGITGNTFAFLGFVPQKKGRETFFKGVTESDIPVVFYESPHRIMKTLTALSENLSTYRKVIVARELTKMHEEVATGTPEEVAQYFREHPDHQKGEFVIMVAYLKMPHI